MTVMEKSNPQNSQNELSNERGEKVEQGTVPDKLSKLSKALRHLKTLIVLKRPAMELRACYDGIARMVEEAVAVGDDVTAAVDELMRLQGYTSDRPGLFALPGNDTGMNGKPGDKAGEQAHVEAGREQVEAKAKIEGEEIANRETPVLDQETKQALEWVRARRAEEERAVSDAKRREAVEMAIDSARSLLGELSADEQEFLLGNVRKYATSAEQVVELVSDALADYSRIAAKQRLAAQGLGVRGSTVANAGGRVERMTQRPPAYREQVDRLLAVADDVRRRNPNEFGKERVDPKRRAYNRKQFIEPLLEEMAARRAACKSYEEFAALDSALASGDERQFCEAFDSAWSAASDATTLANVYNQPGIAEFMVYQTYQDMRMLQFVGGIGPRLDQMDGRGGFTLTGSANNRTHVGSVLRIPSEFYQPPALGSGAGYQGTYDEGLFIGENQAIPEGVVTLNYLSYAPFSRRLGASIGRDARNAMGNGPLNYPLIARHIAHIGMHKERTLDKALADEMTLTSD